MMSLIEQGVPPLFLSMEMRAFELAKLFISTHSGVPAWRWEKDVNSGNMIEAAKKFFDSVMMLDTQSYLSVEQVKAKVIRASQKGCRVVFIDFLQRMNFPDHKNKNFATVVADTVARLADIGRDYNVAMVILSQLRNQAEGEEIADMRFLKDSGGIAENADAIITLTNKQRQETGEAKYLQSDKVGFWISVEQRSGSTSLIKAVAELGICRFYVPSPDPITEPGRKRPNSQTVAQNETLRN
jgi:replicative DNA helicase